MSELNNFTGWLMEQFFREDAIGDLSCDVMHDSGWPDHVDTLGGVLTYLDEMCATPPVIEAAKNAWAEWSMKA